MQHVGQHYRSGHYHQFNRGQRYNFNHRNGNSDFAFHHGRHYESERRNCGNHWDNNHSLYSGEQLASFPNQHNTDNQHSTNFQQSTKHFYSAKKLDSKLANIQKRPQQGRFALFEEKRTTARQVQQA